MPRAHMQTRTRRTSLVRNTARTASALRTIYFPRSAEGWSARPLETLLVVGAEGGVVSVTDGEGREYVRVEGKPELRFTVAGALGTHTIRVLDQRGKVSRRATFQVDAATAIEDASGEYKDLLEICNRTMRCYHPSGATPFEWKGQTYYWFVYWILDHSHTAKGMQFFSPHARGLVDILRQVQREDGMIWSNVQHDPGPGHFDTAYGPDGYAVRRDGLLLVRQPVENHCEYNYVDTIYMHWKASGDDAWMKKCLDSACRALDYTIHDRARFSQKLGLLIRGYTIDSWDFQVEDEYTVNLGQGNAMRIDPDRTKMGVFFGDNTGYAMACEELAEMLEYAGRRAQAEIYRQRRQQILSRLTELAWNGRFFQHRVEEDPTVKRNLGVDEKSQIAMSNAYSINRGIPHEQCVAIIKTYLDLKAHLPPRSPGEWYAIYPPFGRGFGGHGERWQYMNGGVHGHAAGELARGAFEHGYEWYGADILARLRALAHATAGRGPSRGGDESERIAREPIIRFAYTGAYEPPPPPQQFQTIDLSSVANMDLWDTGAAGVAHWMMEPDSGNDMRNLPVGDQTFAGVPYHVTDPATNGRRAALGISLRENFAVSAEVPIGRTAGAIYLLHTCGAVGPSGIVAAMTFRYADGSEESRYIINGTHVTGWWYPHLSHPDAGVAWRGPNPRSTDVGLSWAAIPNPRPDQTIASIRFSASAEGAKYAVVAITLADRMPYHEPSPVSYGGPDNWAGGCVTLALIEGLAGVKNASTALRSVRLSPRWCAAGVEQVTVTARYQASQGYVAYHFVHNRRARLIEMEFTGGGDKGVVRVLLPKGARKVKRTTLNGKLVPATVEFVEESAYAVVEVPRLPVVNRLRLAYGG